MLHYLNYDKVWRLSAPNIIMNTLQNRNIREVSSIIVAFYDRTCYLFCCSPSGPLDIKNALQSVVVPKLFLVLESMDCRVVGQRLPK